MFWIALLAWSKNLSIRTFVAKTVNQNDDTEQRIIHKMMKNK